MLSCRCCETAYATANSAAVIAPTIDSAALAGAASAGGFGAILRPHGWRCGLASSLVPIMAVEIAPPSIAQGNTRWPTRCLALLLSRADLASCKTLAIQALDAPYVSTSAPDFENCVWIGSLYGWFTLANGRPNRSVSRTCAQVLFYGTAACYGTAIKLETLNINDYTLL